MQKKFRKKYGLCLYDEQPQKECPSIIDAIQKEKNLKHYPRKWKINLIEKANENWKDLWNEIV